MVDGIININKEAGMTSSDVVVRLRRILKQKKIGHTGTLDPMAVGVLPICVGRATRLSDYIMDKDKEYIAELTLGAQTDTQDGTGEIIARTQRNVSEEELREVLGNFIGELAQTPPMYSAIKIAGKKLYEYAREGKMVERASRKITVYGIELLENREENRFLIKIHCSKGTYVRTICADIGEALGVGGYMSSLSRVRAGCYAIEQAFTLKEIEKMVSREDYSFLRPMDEPISQFKRVDVKKEFSAKFLNGNQLQGHMYSAQELSAGDRVRAYLEDDFKGICTFDGQLLKIMSLIKID